MRREPRLVHLHSLLHRLGSALNPSPSPSRNSTHTLPKSDGVHRSRVLRNCFLLFTFPFHRAFLSSTRNIPEQYVRASRFCRHSRGTRRGFHTACFQATSIPAKHVALRKKKKTHNLHDGSANAGAFSHHRSRNASPALQNLSRPIHSLTVFIVKQEVAQTCVCNTVVLFLFLFVFLHGCIQPSVRLKLVLD